MLNSNRLNRIASNLFYYCIILPTGKFSTFHITPNSDGKDELHINLRHGKINIDASITAFRFKDRDTNKFIFFIPSLEISGYGDSSDEATEMAKLGLDDLFENLSTLSQKECTSYLIKMGWRQGWFKKDFSKAYVDALGELKNFNVEIDKVEKVT